MKTFIIKIIYKKNHDKIVGPSDKILLFSILVMNNKYYCIIFIINNYLGDDFFINIIIQ